MLKNLDQFGIEFPLRVAGYKRYKTNSGGCCFLIYLLVIIIYLSLNLYEFFNNPKYHTITYNESFENNTANLKNQNFTYILSDPLGYIKRNQLEVKSQYINDYENKSIPININNCREKNFHFHYINNNTKNIYCFENKKEQEISVDAFKKKQIDYTISLGKNSSELKRYYLQGIFPINNVRDHYISKTIGMQELILDNSTMIVVFIHLEKNIHIIDESLFPFFGHNKTLEYLNTHDFSTISRKRKTKDPLIKLIIRQSYSVKVKYSRRQKIYVLLLNCLNMATTILANFSVIVSIVNSKKAKQSIFENIFHINKIGEEININNINNINNIIETEMINFEINKKEMIDKKEIDEAQNIQKIINQSNENEKSSIEGNNRQFNAFYPFYPIGEVKIIKEKIEKIYEKYPSIIKGSKQYKNDPRFVRNFFEYLELNLLCKKSRKKEVDRIYNIIERQFADTMNVFNFIEKSKKFEKIVDSLFEKDERILFDFITMPLLNVDKEVIENKKNKLKDIDLIFRRFNAINMKKNKSDSERKLLQFFIEKLDQN